VVAECEREVRVLKKQTRLGKNLKGGSPKTAKTEEEKKTSLQAREGSKRPLHLERRRHKRTTLASYLAQKGREVGTSRGGEKYRIVAGGRRYQEKNWACPEHRGESPGKSPVTWGKKRRKKKWGLKKMSTPCAKRNFKGWVRPCEKWTPAKKGSQKGQTKVGFTKTGNVGTRAGVGFTKKRWGEGRNPSATEKKLFEDEMKFNIRDGFGGVTGIGSCLG